MVDTNASLADLLRNRHAEIPLFIVNMVNTDKFEGAGSEAGKRLFREHLLYWWKLEDAGHLLGAGPVDLGQPNQEGFAVLIATSIAEALELARAEPFHQAGWRRNTVRSWQLNEGTLVPTARSMWQEHVAKL